MNNKTLDVAIIGAGSAGLAALREIRKRTQRFVIINDEPWGTVCARVGCMPSKLLIEAANAFHRRNTFMEFGIQGADFLKCDIPNVLRRVRRLRDDFVRSTVKTTQDLGERAITGRARLLAPDRLEVNGQELHAHNIIIATGSSPVVPIPWRVLGNRLLTTDTLFEQETLPARMAVLGLGPVGIEIAQALSRLGIEVTGLGSNPAIAGLTDPQVCEVAIELLRQEFPLQLGDKAELTATREGLSVHSGTISIAVDSALAALGRQPNISNLGLETLGVLLDNYGMPPINPATLQVSDLRVFMAGDANAQTPILHEAADDGYIAGLNATSSIPVCFKRRTPLAIVFSDPSIAVVGSHYQALDHAKTLVGTVNFDRQGRARISQCNKGILNIYAEMESGRLLGAEMCAPAGEHLAHLIALAISHSLTVHDLLRMPFYHPVLEEGLRTGLRALAAQLPAGKQSDLATCNEFNIDALD